jgi:tetratricopeptide (TPR) repeat protein
MPADDALNKSKTLRFIARVHLEMNQLDEALIAASDAEQLDRTAFQTLFLLFQIHCQQRNTQEATEYLRKSTATEDFHTDYFAVAAQTAYEVLLIQININNTQHGSDIIAMEALECLLKSDASQTIREKGTILRHLVSLSQKTAALDKMVHYLKIVVDLLKSKGSREIFKSESVETELEWFHRICW